MEGVRYLFGVAVPLIQGSSGGKDPPVIRGIRNCG